MFALAATLASTAARCVLPRSSADSDDRVRRKEHLLLPVTGEPNGKLPHSAHFQSAFVNLRSVPLDSLATRLFESEVT